MLLSFVVGVITGFGLSLLIIGFLAVLAEEDEKKMLKMQEELRIWESRENAGNYYLK